MKRSLRDEETLSHKLELGGGWDGGHAWRGTPQEPGVAFRCAIQCYEKNGGGVWMPYTVNSL